LFVYAQRRERKSAAIALKKGEEKKEKEEERDRRLGFFVVKNKDVVSVAYCGHISKGIEHRVSERDKKPRFWYSIEKQSQRETKIR